MNVEDNNAVLQNEFIYLDSVFLTIIDCYTMIRQRINFCQRFTNSVAYRITSGVLCFFIYLLLTASVLTSYNEVNRSMNSIVNKDVILREILRNEEHKIFFEDTILFPWTNEHYLYEKYRPLVEFITKEFSYLQIRHDEVNRLKQRLSLLNIFIATFPFILCLSWWTNTLTIAVAFVGHLTPEESIDPSLPYSAFLSGFLGISLLIIHFVTLFLASIELLRRRVNQ